RRREDPRLRRCRLHHADPALRVVGPEGAARPRHRRRDASGAGPPAARLRSSGGNRLTPELFRFLEELRKHNERDWFHRNKDRYLGQVRDPLLAFITAIGPKLRAIGPHIVADARPSGGSLLRIYRDTRFSRDKTPYQTHAALWFRLAADKEVEGPGYYLHLERGRSFMGAGMWRPSPDALRPHLPSAGAPHEIPRQGDGARLLIEWAQRAQRASAGWDTVRSTCGGSSNGSSLRSGNLSPQRAMTGRMLSR